MTIDGHLKIPGIDGDSTDSQHHDEITIHSVTWQIAQPDAGSTGSRRRGGFESSAFDFGKVYDRSSPLLAKAVADGQLFDEIVFTVTRPLAGGPTDYLVVTLTEATIVAYSLGTGDNELEEVVSLRAQQIDIDYRLFDSQGTASGSIPVTVKMTQQN